MNDKEDLRMSSGKDGMVIKREESNCRWKNWGEEYLGSNFDVVTFEMDIKASK